MLFTAVDIRQYRTTLIFRPLRTSRFVTIPIVDDTEYTQDVVVLVTLSLRTTGVDVLLNPDTTSIKILDDDGWFFSYHISILPNSLLFTPSGPLNFLSPTFTFSILTSDGAATTTTTADSAFPFGSSATARVYVSACIVLPHNFTHRSLLAFKIECFSIKLLRSSMCNLYVRKPLCSFSNKKIAQFIII